MASTSSRDDSSDRLSQHSFWNPQVPQPVAQLEYMLNGEKFSVKADAYDGFTRIWKALLGGRKQLQDTEVAEILRSSGMADEALANVWQEASQAIILATDPDQLMDPAVEDEINWQDFIILLDTSWRMSGSNLDSFLSHFPLPSTRTSSIRGKKNPFKAKQLLSLHERVGPASDSGGPFLSLDKKESSPSQSYSASHISSYSWVAGKAAVDMLSTTPGEAGIPPKTPWNLETLKEGSHTDDLKEIDIASYISTLSALQPVIPEGIEFVEHSGMEGCESRSDLGKSPAKEITIELTEGAPSSIQTQTITLPLAGAIEVEVPHCTPEIRRIVKNRLQGLEGSDRPALKGEMLKNSLKSLTRSLSSNEDQGSGRFSLSTLARGLEGAVKDNSLPILEALFEFGADPNYSVKGSKPIRHRALEFAAVQGQSRVLDYLIQRGADPTAVNTALVHAVMAGKAGVATRLIVVYNADVDSGVFLPTINDSYGPRYYGGLHSSVEYLNVLSAAENIQDKSERLQFLQLLISRNCNLNAYFWSVYKLKELADESRKRVPRTVEDGFGYSALAAFAGFCPSSVKILLDAGVTASTTYRYPPKHVLKGFKQHGFTCQTYSIVQPISCITVSEWEHSSSLCIETVQALAHHGVDLCVNEPNGYEEKHSWRKKYFGGFVGKVTFKSNQTPIQRARDGKIAEGIACLQSLQDLK